MSLVCKQSSSSSTVLKTAGDSGAQISGITVYNTSGSSCTLTLRAYDSSNDLSIILEEITVDGGAASKFSMTVVLESSDEARVENLSETEIHYTFNSQDSTRGNFHALVYDNTSLKYVTGPSYSPFQNNTIRAFNVESSESHFIGEAHDNSTDNTNKIFSANIPSRSAASISTATLESYDFLALNNDVAKTFDVFAMDAAVPTPSFTKNFSGNSWVKFVNRTLGTANPVNIHIEFKAFPTGEDYDRHNQDCGMENNIYTAGTVTDSSGNVTDVTINVMIDQNSTWTLPAYQYWNDGTFLNEDGTALPMQNLATAYSSTTCPAGGIGWEGSPYGSYPCYPKDATAKDYLQVQIGIGDTEYKAGWDGQPRWWVQNSVFRNVGSAIYSSSFVPYDSDRAGYWLDLNIT